MNKVYSWKKGLLKGVVSFLSIGGALVAFAGFSDITVWSLVEQYLKPIIGSLTIGGAITMLANWFKFKYLS